MFTDLVQLKSTYFYVVFSHKSIYCFEDGPLVISDDVVRILLIRHTYAQLASCKEISTFDLISRCISLVGGTTDNVTLFLGCNLKLASTTEFHIECNTLHYNETAKHCGVNSLLLAGC